MPQHGLELLGGICYLAGMKRTLFAMLLAAAGIVQGATASGLRYHLPATGVLPSFAAFEMFSYLHERHGNGSLAMQKYSLTLPLSDPRRSGYEAWMFNASFDTEISHMHAGGFDLRKRELFDFALPLSLIRNYPSGNRLILAAAPTIASDFVKWDRALSMNGLAEYRIKASENFSYAFGVAVTPRLVSWGALPVVSFEWKPSEDWNVKLGGARLTVMHTLPRGWSAGLFASAAGGSWTVATDDANTRLFRVRSVVAGCMAEWDFSRPDQRKRVVNLAVGMPIITTAEYCRFNAHKKTLGKHHYGTGIYASAAVDFRF